MFFQDKKPEQSLADAASTEEKEMQLGDYFLQELTIEQVIKYVKLPREYLEKALKFCEEYNLLFSIREKDPIEIIYFLRSNRRASLPSDPKTTKTSGKSIHVLLPAHGRIARDAAAHTLDNNLPGAFLRKDFVMTGEEQALLAQLKANVSDKIAQVQLNGGLISYSENCFKQRAIKGADGKKVIIGTTEPMVKHYVQEAESLDSILFKMENGGYTDFNLKGGKLFFKANDGQNQQLMFELKDIFPATSKALDWSKIDFSDAKSLPEKFAKFITDNEVSDSHLPLWKVTANAEKYEPFMVHAGRYGRPIGGDTDPQNVGIMLGLPESAHIPFFSKTADIELFLQTMTQCIGELKDINFDAKIISLFEETLAYYESHNDEFTEIGTSTIYSVVMQHAFDDPMWLHGAEDIHPCGTPENFSGTLTACNGKFYLTGGEKAYLDLLFTVQPRVIGIQEIGVHPNYLRDGREKGADGVDLSQYWMDLIELQVLSAYNSCKEADKKMPAALKIIANAIERVKIVDGDTIEKGEYFRADNKIEVATNAVKKLEALAVKMKDSLPNTQAADGVEKLYAKYNKDVTIAPLNDGAVAEKRKLKL